MMWKRATQVAEFGGGPWVPQEYGSRWPQLFGRDGLFGQ
jgi:hypothetical protein